MSGDGTIIIDTPEGIEAYMLLSVYHTLKMEVDRPHGPKWRANPAAQARVIMSKAGYTPEGKTRSKADTLTAFVKFLEEKGINVNSK